MFEENDICNTHSVLLSPVQLSGISHQNDETKGSSVIQGPAKIICPRVQENLSKKKRRKSFKSRKLGLNMKHGYYP